MRQHILIAMGIASLAGCEANKSTKTVAIGEINGKEIRGYIDNQMLPGVITPIGYLDKNHKKALFYDIDKNIMLVGCKQSTSESETLFAPCN